MKTKGKFTLKDLNEFEGYIHGLSTSGLRKMTHVQAHHTWSPSYRNFNGSNHFEKLESMEAYHISEGWSQIGQHYTTFPDGMIATCRSLAVAPACIKGHNTGGICIENLGNFDLHGDVITPAHNKTITHLNALLCLKFNLPVDTNSLVYHHWFRQSDGFRDNGLDKMDVRDHKTCPGTNFFGGNRVADAQLNFTPEVQKAFTAYNSAARPPAVTVLKGKVNVAVLNVRKGTAVEFAVVEKLNRNDVVTILETVGEWDRIGADKWVKADYLVILP